MGSPSNVFVKKEESQSLTFGKVGEKKAVKKQYKQEAQNEIIEINPNISVIAINVNGLNRAIKNRENIRLKNIINPNIFL